MNKRGLVILILLASISFVSAQVGIGEFLDAFGGDNLLLIGSFVVSFTLIYFILGRLPVFKTKSKEYPYGVERNKAVPGVIAFVISLFIVYGIHQANFDLADFFFKLGIGSELLELIAILAVLAGIVFLFWKLKSWVFLILGLLLFGVSLTDWVYEKGTVMIAGIALIILWLLIKIFSRKKKERQEEYISRPTIIRGEDRQPQLEAEKRELERRLRETERLKREAEERAKQRRRSVYDLKQKYLSYLFQYNMARKKPERRKRIKQAMYIIISYAEKLGYPKKVFLSKDVAGNSAKPPEELKD